MTGRFYVSGDLGLGMQLQSLFPALEAAFRSIRTARFAVIACTRRVCA